MTEKASFQLRVIGEKKQLDKNLKKLGTFIDENEIYKTLDRDEQTRLHMQRYFMNEYSKVLGERINAFVS